MRKFIIPFIIIFSLPAIFFTSCGEDRSGEYYALISTKTWMYETMQKNYLFREDLPAEGDLDFFKKPNDFLRSVASPRDQKNGILFSHIDSVKAKRATSQFPSFGIEGVLVRNRLGDNAVHILYTYPNSPASEMGLKRDHWILLADSQQISSSNFEQYISRPTQACRYLVARTTDDGKPDTVFIDMPAPRMIPQPSVLLTTSIPVGNKNAYYIAYNSFEPADEQELRDAFAKMPASTTDIILDLRYNPGGSIATAVLLSTYLAPANAINQTCVELIPNNDIEQHTIYKFDSELLQGAPQANYQNLYILTTSNTASASELVINCLRPYLQGRLFQVGEATFGKNVAQSLFTDSSIPELEFWLTTAYVSNSKGEYNYYDKGLQPDFLLEENLNGTLGELGTAQDSLIQPVLYHIANGSFPTKPEIKGIPYNKKVIINTVSSKPKKNQKDYSSIR